MKRVKGIARYADNKERVVVWCSGTNGWDDCRDNVQFRRVKIGEGIKVSMADHEEAVEVIEALHDVLDNASRNVKRIDVAGVSKGGAVAAIVAILLKMDGYNIRYEGFAPKRFGNHAAMKYLDNYVSSFITAYPFDVVPFLPFWWARYGIIAWSHLKKTPWRAHIDSVKDAARWRYLAAREDQ